MALITDPRIFALPKFRVEPDGSFVLPDDAPRPQPSDIFECREAQLASASPALPLRNSAEATPIVYGPKGTQATFVTSAPKDFPVFWHAEIMTEQSKVCDELVYEELLQLRKAPNAAYLGFGDKQRPVPLKVNGRLLEIVVYLLFFEADESSAGAVREWLEEQSLKEVIAEHWKELTTIAVADLRGGRSFAKQLGAKYPAAAAVFECLG